MSTTGGPLAAGAAGALDVLLHDAAIEAARTRTPTRQEDRLGRLVVLMAGLAGCGTRRPDRPDRAMAMQSSPTAGRASRPMAARREWRGWRPRDHQSPRDR